MTCNKNDFFTFLTSYNTKIEANEILYEGLICGKPSMKPVLKLNTKTIYSYASGIACYF